MTVYILEGAFTPEMERRPPVTVKAGESMVEPPRVKMTGYNKSSNEATKVLILYVSDPDVPFSIQYISLGSGQSAGGSLGSTYWAHCSFPRQTRVCLDSS